MDIPAGGIEERLLRLLLESGTVPASDLRRWLRVPRARLNRALRALRSRGIVAVEPLAHATLVTLRRRDLRFVGVKRGQKHAVRRSVGGDPRRLRSDPMFQ